MANRPGIRGLFLVGILLIGLLLLLFAFIPKYANVEISRASSPDGGTDAVIFDVSPAFSTAHSFKVCFQRPRFKLINSKYCNEVAYLAGVPMNGSTVPIRLVWTEPAQFEIQYSSATYIHIYKPVFFWASTGGSSRSITGSSTKGAYSPIFVKAIKDGDRAGGPTRLERGALASAPRRYPNCLKLDRLGRSVKGLVNLVDGLEAREVHFRSFTDGIDTKTPAGRFFFHIMASLAQMERELIGERTHAGLAAARKLGPLAPANAG